jgi:TPR repeat protein
MSKQDIERALDEIERKNFSGAVQLLMPLAESGNPKAMCNLATLYQCGLGVPIDGKKAIALFERVGQMNIHEEKLSAIAYHNLATIYSTGLPGVEPDPLKAQQLRDRARQLGFEM